MGCRRAPRWPPRSSGRPTAVTEWRTPWFTSTVVWVLTSSTPHTGILLRQSGTSSAWEGLPPSYAESARSWRQNRSSPREARMAQAGQPTPTVTELLLARQRDNNPGLLFEDQRWSWAEHIRECGERAALLRALRRPGPFHVGVLLDNVPEFSFLL